jgi:hypothetical protein
MTSIIQGTWKGEKEAVSSLIREKLEKVDKLMEHIREVPEKSIRDLLVLKCNQANEKLDIEMSNIQSMQEQLNVSISFLASLKKQLSKVEQRLIDVTEELKEIKQDLKYLVGKSISELIDNKYTEVTEDQGFAKVHIPIKATFFEDNDQHESFDLMTGVYDFIRDTAKSTLLVLGEAGSGKSTFLKYLQKNLLANWKNSKGGMSELFEGLSTDELTIVKKNLEELDLGVALTELISNMTEEDFQSRLFMPSEMGRIRAQFEKVSQTKDLTHVLKMGDPEKGIIIPIWCS